MSDALLDALEELLRASVATWSLSDDPLPRSSGDQIQLSGANAVIKVSRAAEGMPFRWVVEVGGRKRTAASVVGVLRIVRQTLAPGYQPYQLAIAPLHQT